MIMIGLLWVLNFVISIFNAWGCGHTWDQTKQSDTGIPHFLNWCGAVMSACGFTWCYTILLAFVASVTPHTLEDGSVTTWLSPEGFQATLEMGYMIVTLPILGSGLVITLESWAYAWRRRTLGSGGIAAYNTFAQVHNAYSAVQTIPGVFSHLSKFFSSSSGKKDGQGTIVIVLAIAALLSGVLTTVAIITATRNSVKRHA